MVGWVDGYLGLTCCYVGSSLSDGRGDTTVDQAVRYVADARPDIQIGRGDGQSGCADEVLVRHQSFVASPCHYASSLNQRSRELESTAHMHVRGWC